MRSPLLLLSALCGIHIQAAEIGKPHSTVITLTATNFDEHIKDPANGLWLLKFYAPWCGHCKKLEPVLNKVAPHLAGKMAIGKVDCTTEKKLCKRFDVRGYPTLKYYRDTEFHDYPSGRDADSIM
jgi:protein disulfide-isomerase-like protein